MKIFTIIIGLSLSLFSSTAFSGADQVNQKSSIQLADQWIHYLAHDDRQGRLTGSEESQEVQQWLIERYQQIGIQTLPQRGSYLQKFTAHNRQGEPLSAANVIGYIPCQCDSQRYFVIGGHYDHIGVNNKLEGDTVYNGADDDASGIVASLIIAKKLQEFDQLPFNVIIAAWDAEEIGLQGSKYFAQHPLVPLQDIESGFMLELVGVPLKDQLNSAWMTGEKYSSLYSLMKQYLQSEGWKLDPVLDPKMGLFFRSDNAPFVLLKADDKAIRGALQGKDKAKVTGIPMHAISVWRGQDHYHQTHDEAKLINVPNLVSLAEALATAFSKLPSTTHIKWLENPQFEFSRPTQIKSQ